MRTRLLIPVKNRQWILPDFLDCLKRLDYPTEDLSIHLVDDGSNDNSLPTLRQFARSAFARRCEKVIVEALPGTGEPNTSSRDARRRISCYAHLAALRNALIGRALVDGVDAVLMLDSDTLCKPGLLTRLLSLNLPCVGSLNFVDCPTSGLGVDPPRAHGVINAAYFMPDREAPRDVSRYQLGKVTRWQPDTVIPVDVTGGTMWMDRSALLTGVRHDAHPKGEQVPFCAGLKNAGVPVYLDTTLLSVHVMKPEHLAAARAWVNRG